MQRPDATEQLDGHVQRSSWASTFSALAYRNFRLLWFGTVFMSAGNWVQQVTLGWLAFELTNSPLQVSIVLGLRALPMLGSPLAGVLADTFDRRRLLLMDQAYLATLAVGFAVIILFGVVEVWHLHVFSFLTGAGWGLNNPLRQTLVANSIPRDKLMNGIALSSMAFNSMRMIGPAVGGFLIVLFGPGLNFVLQAVMYLGMMAVVLPYRAEYAESREGNPQQSPLAGLVEALRYVATHPVLRIAIMLSMIPMLSLMSFIQTQMPVYAARDLGQDASALGLLLTAMGIGGFLGSILVARFYSIQHKGRMSLSAVAGAALAVLALSQVTVLWLAMVVLVIQQMFFIMVMTTNNTILQTITPDRMRGRVVGIYMLDVGMMPLGGVIAGIIATYYSVSFAWIIGGATGLLLVTVVAVFAPAFRRLKL